MAVVKEIGCFITGSWTEAGAMTLFLKRINNNYEYVQCFPNKPKFKRGLTGDTNGFTGDKLIEEMLRRIQLYKEQYANYSAFIVEDDLDCRFFNKSDQQISNYKSQIQTKVNSIMGREVPIIFLYASPEIEAWFLSDWSNTFSKIYRNDFFINRLRAYIDSKVIKEYWEKGIENYGIINGQYVKLSDQIIDAIKMGVREEIQKEFEGKQMSKKVLQALYDSKELYYSKRDHGDQMLRYLSPENLLIKCNCFFSPTYREIKNL